MPPLFLPAPAFLAPEECSESSQRGAELRPTKYMRGAEEKGDEQEQHGSNFQLPSPSAAPFWVEDVFILQLESRSLEKQ